MKHRNTLGALAAAVMLAYAPAYANAAAAAKPAVVERAPAKSNEAAKKQFWTLADEYYDAIAKYDPVGATQNGDNRFDDQIGSSIAPATRAKQFDLYRAFAKRLQAVPRAQLNRGDRISYDVMAFELKTYLAYQPFPEHLLPIDHMGSMPVTLANFSGGDAAQPLTTVKEYEAYLNRLNQLPAWVDQAIANMKEGVAKGITQPKAIMTAALPQFQKLVSETPEKNIYFTPVTKFPASFSDADKQRLAAAYRATVADKLNPAIAKLAAYVEKEYIPACRTSTGWNALPNGEAWYKARIADSTTTSKTAEEIHQTGLREVARIQAEFAKLGPKLGYNGAAAGLPGWIAQQPQFFPFKTDEEVLEVYRKLDKVLDTKLPAMFTLIPKAKLDLRLEPELSRDTASDHYTAPALDGSRPGVFWSVVTDPKKYGNTGMNTLYLHEGKPGHHFHIALMQELDMPKFRKFGGNTAFTEGWALYAETLGKEMGMFEDPAQYFGHLSDEMLRAVRLVVDTGMHAKGWTREQSIKYMTETLGDEAVARNQTERYMVWPAQALAYKTGSLKIQELRAKAEKALGSKFTLAKFHAIVLGDGTVPLALLETKVDAWIASAK